MPVLNKLHKGEMFASRRSSHANHLGYEVEGFVIIRVKMFLFEQVDVMAKHVS